LLPGLHPGRGSRLQNPATQYRQQSWFLLLSVVPLHGLVKDESSLRSISNVWLGLLLVPVRAGTGSNQGAPARRPGKVPQTWGSRGAISTPAGKKIRFFSSRRQMAVPGLRLRVQLPLQDLTPARRRLLAGAEVEAGMHGAALPALYPP